MAGTQGFDFDPARLEGSFSNLQPINDTVQSSDSTMPGCCSRTRVTINCRAFERGYSLELPLRTKLANESPSDPPHNHQSHVMVTQMASPMLQVLSCHDGNGVAEIGISSSGPPQCPPGKPSRLKLEGIGGGMREVPFASWNWQAPAILDAALMEELDEDMISLLHPFKMPDLPAQVWKMEFPGCQAAKISATIAAFPDVRWQGRLTLLTKAKQDFSAGYEVLAEGDLACIYNARRFEVRDKIQARALCKWVDCLDVLARSVVALMELHPGPRHAGLDNPRLAHLEELRFEPWPRLTLAIDACLFEQEGNGLLGHALRVLVQGDSLLGASGEMSLLGSWLEQTDKVKLLSPVLAALDVVRSEEIAQELGIWLVADGHISIRAGVEVRRPVTKTAVLARASGEVRLALEVRSIRDYDSFVIQQGGAADASANAGFHAACEPPTESSLNDPKESKCRAAVDFSGLAVGRMEKRRPGCCFRRVPEPDNVDTEKKHPAGCLLAPSRSWPGGGEPGQLAEISWCD